MFHVHDKIPVVRYYKKTKLKYSYISMQLVRNNKYSMVVYFFGNVLNMS